MGSTSDSSLQTRVKGVSREQNHGLVVLSGFCQNLVYLAYKTRRAAHRLVLAWRYVVYIVEMYQFQLYCHAEKYASEEERRKEKWKSHYALFHAIYYKWSCNHIETSRIQERRWGRGAHEI